MRTRLGRGASRLGRGAWLAALVVVAGCRSGSNVAPPVTTPPASSGETEANALSTGGAPVVKVVLDAPHLAAARAFAKLDVELENLLARKALI